MTETNTTVTERNEWIVLSIRRIVVTFCGIVCDSVMAKNKWMGWVYFWIFQLKIVSISLKLIIQ